jgi:hypothetical protein
MKGIFYFLAVLFCLVNYSWACDINGQSGIVEENNLWIGVDQKDTSNITENEFNKIIDQIETIYKPLVQSKGGNLNIERNWDDGTVNAYALRTGKIWKVSMFGGLARHQTITGDAFALVLCHEIGHHLGGAPHKKSWWGSEWASNEGQADYYGSMKCLRRFFEPHDNLSIVEEMEIDPYVSEKCHEVFSNSTEIAMCMRTSMAGLSLGNLFRALKNLRTKLNFTNPDPKVVTVTNDGHPDPQCRLDTYFAGAICDKDFNLEPSDSDVNLNVCSRIENDLYGVRPLCWYAPPTN